eukprot:gene44891-45346_t
MPLLLRIPKTGSRHWADLLAAHYGRDRRWKGDPVVTMLRDPIERV